MSATDIATIFLDIDGCLVKHTGDMTMQMEGSHELLPGVKEKLILIKKQDIR